jgi:hypothetical protein
MPLMTYITRGRFINFGSRGRFPGDRRFSVGAVVAFTDNDVGGSAADVRPGQGSGMTMAA